jgi:hypothetical protein
LLSYFNQPDHELIDRRSEAVLKLLLRIAFSNVAVSRQTSSTVDGLEGLPPRDSEPLSVDEFKINMIWRSARVAAVELFEAPNGLGDKLAAKGIDLVLLPEGAHEREQQIVKLASLLGANPS